MIKPGEVLRREDLLIQLSEESAELSQAAAKMARFIMGRNPTGKSEEELADDIEEKLTDVMIAAEELPYRPNWDIARKKKERWARRLQEKANKEKPTMEEDPDL